MSFSSDSQRRAHALIDEGNTCEDLHDLEAATSRYYEATRIAPSLGRAWLNLGIALAAKMDDRGAIAAFDQALEVEPGNVPAQYNRGLAQSRLGDCDAAAQSLILALSLRPQFSDARIALADVFEKQGKVLLAETELQIATKQVPNHAGYLLNLGLLQTKLRKLDEAELALRASIEAAPTFPRPAAALAAVLRDKGKHVDACMILERFLRSTAPDFDVISSLLFTSLFRDDLCAADIFILHRRWGAQMESDAGSLRETYEARPRSDRIRVGYVSGDFRRHAVANFFLPVIVNHDRANFDVFCYSNSEVVDDVTARIRAAADGWRDIYKLDDSAASKLIIDDGIDLLVDLSGYSGGGRLTLFLRNPAPVQVAWLGYLSTTGLTRIDYRICDSFTDPPKVSQPLHTERLLALQDSQWCFRPYLEPKQDFDLPMSRNGVPTFGSFNQFAKISPTCREIWIDVLKRVPASRLLIVGIPEGDSRDTILEQFGARGIGPDRLLFQDRLDLRRYYDAIQQVDIALDTTPYSGATTTCDALWVGVPVVALAGERPVARSAASILTVVGLPELVANTKEEYVTIAAGLASKPARLADLRRTLRSRMRESRLMDEPAFVHGLESIYTSIWAEWAKNGPRSGG